MTNYYRKYSWWEGYNSVNEIQYKVFYDENKIVVMFQGTNEQSDIKTNFDFPAAMYKNCNGKPIYIHRGFKEAYHTVRDTVLKAIDEALLNYRVKDILVLGWSYGGVLASLLHEDLKTNRPAFNVETYVYGTPKFCFLPSKEIRDRFKDIHRVEMIGDFIPLLVPFYSALGTLDRVGEFKLIPNIKYHMMY